MGKYHPWQMSLGVKREYCSLCPVPLSGVTDRAALSAQLLSTDNILNRIGTASYFSDFTQAGRMLLFGIDDDGYPDGIPAAVTIILAAANTYSVTHLGYNLEWPGNGPLLATRLAAVRAELDVQGNTRPLIFGPTYGFFVSLHEDFEPFCEGFEVQLQNADVGTEATLAAQAIATVTPGYQMYFQISANTTNRTFEQVISAAISTAAVNGVTGVHLFFGSGAYWTFCQSVLDILRPNRP